MPDEQKVSSNEVFRLTGAYFLYQDQLGWSRMQTIVAIEAAVLAGAFGIRGPLSVVVLVAGALVEASLFWSIYRDWRIRDHTYSTLKEFPSEAKLCLEPASTWLSPKTVSGRLVLVAGAFLVAANLAFAWLWCAWVANQPQGWLPYRSPAFWLGS